MQKKSSFTIDGGYLPTYVPQLDGTLKPNLLLNPLTGEKVIGPDGNPVFNQYAFMPDIELELGLRGVYSAGLMLEQPIYICLLYTSLFLAELRGIDGLSVFALVCPAEVEIGFVGV